MDKQETFDTNPDSTMIWIEVGGTYYSCFDKLITLGLLSIGMQNLNEGSCREIQQNAFTRSLMHFRASHAE